MTSGRRGVGPRVFPSTGGESARGVGLALASALAFGTLGVWGKLALAVGLSTPTLLSWRFALGTLALLAFGALRGRLTWRERLLMLAFGLLYALATSLYFAALSRITAGTTSLLLYLSPAFVVLYAALLGQRPSLVHLGALALTLAGLGVVIGLPGPGDGDSLGLALGALTGAAYGAYLLGGERFLGAQRPLTISAHVTLGSWAYFTVWGLAQGTLGVPGTPAQWGVVLGITVVPTLLALPALFGAIARLGAARASLLATTEPVWTVLLATLVLGESVRAGQLLGGLLILGGAALAQWAPRARVKGGS